MDGFSAIQGFQGNGLVQTAIHGSDANIYAEFRIEPVYLEFDSQQEGRPIYKDAEFVRLNFAGDRTKQLDRLATDEDRQRFAHAYRQFKKNEEQLTQGTPLKEWTLISRSQAAELNAMHIHSVEQLAAIADTNLNGLGMRGLREQAKAWLARADGTKDLSSLTAENQALKDQIQVLSQQIQDLASRIDKDEEPDDGQPKRRGMPKGGWPVKTQGAAA